MTEDLEPVALRAKMSGVSPVQLDSNVGGCRSSAKPFDVEYSMYAAEEDCTPGYMYLNVRTCGFSRGCLLSRDGWMGCEYVNREYGIRNTEYRIQSTSINTTDCGSSTSRTKAEDIHAALHRAISHTLGAKRARGRWPPAPFDDPTSPDPAAAWAAAGGTQTLLYTQLPAVRRERARERNTPERDPESRIPSPNSKLFTLPSSLRGITHPTDHRLTD